VTFTWRSAAIQLSAARPDGIQTVG
jgi:hypothetical protein